MFETQKYVGVILVNPAEADTWRSQGRSHWWTPAPRHVMNTNVCWCHSGEYISRCLAVIRWTPLASSACTCCIKFSVLKMRCSRQRLLHDILVRQQAPDNSCTCVATAKSKNSELCCVNYVTWDSPSSLLQAVHTQITHIHPAAETVANFCSSHVDQRPQN
jgi:hypothetical protein